MLDTTSYAHLSSLAQEFGITEDTLLRALICRYLELETPSEYKSVASEPESLKKTGMNTNPPDRLAEPYIEITPYNETCPKNRHFDSECVTSPADCADKPIFSKTNRSHCDREVTVSRPARARYLKTSLTLPGFLTADLKQRARAENMSVARWVSSLIQSNLTKTPVLTDKELNSLLALSNQLANLNRSYNRTLRFHGADLIQADRSRQTSPESTILPELPEMEEMLESVKVSIALLIQIQQTIHTLARAANRRWDTS